jgi:diacylglycerol kinase (ATP)
MRSFTALVNPISGGGRAAKSWAPLAVRIAGSGARVRVEVTRSPRSCDRAGDGRDRRR